MLPLVAHPGLEGNDTVHSHTPSLAPVFSRSARWTLAIAGLILLGVGAPIFVDPLAYERGVGVFLPEDPTLLSDLRAMAASLLAFGVVLVAGAASRRMGRPAAIAGATLYLSYGLSRVVSMAVDRMPAGALIGAAGLELVVGGLLARVVMRGSVR